MPFFFGLIVFYLRLAQLTWMQFQIRYEFLQLATQYQFSTVFGLCAIVDEQEICMTIVQHGQLRSENGMKNKISSKYRQGESETVGNTNKWQAVNI